MKRTQLYIDETIFSHLEEVSVQKKMTISELVRRALEKVYGRKRNSSERLKAFQSIRGIWQGRTDFPSTQEYIRELRKSRRP